MEGLLPAAQPMATRALTTPAILKRVLELLWRDRADLWACCRVSTLWRDMVHPLIMRHLDIPFRNGDIPLYWFKTLDRYQPNHVRTLRLYDNDIQTIYLGARPTGDSLELRSWRADAEKTKFAEDQIDPRLKEVNDTLTCITNADATTKIELLFGIMSSRQLGKVLVHHPVVLRNISSIFVVCDFVRDVDHPNVRFERVARQNEEGFPVWLEDLTTLLQEICVAQRGRRRLKEVRIETPAIVNITIKPAELDDVKTLVALLPDFLEVFSLHASERQIKPAGIKAVLALQFSKLRSFTFRWKWPEAAEAGVMALSAWLDDFLVRHPQIEALHIETGDEILDLKQTFPHLMSLTLSKTTAHILGSFLRRHPALKSVHVKKLDTPADFDAWMTEWKSLPNITSWRIHHRILSELLSNGAPINMASTTVKRLGEWASPAAYIGPAFPTVTFLALNIDGEGLSSVLVQLGSAFHWARYPNLCELHLTVKVAESIEDVSEDAAECLQQVFLGLGSAIKLRALSLNLWPSRDLPEDSLLNETALSLPPALEYLEWRASQRGKTNTYRVLKEEWRAGRWNRRFLQHTSRSRIAAASGESTVWLDPARPLLDHTCNPPILCHFIPA
ncbi:hypothetical protein OC845_002767 [Tilletia horrida]|nr:hypothetical protein OC845_002767 [Tilletia horrida]